GLLVLRLQGLAMFSRMRDTMGAGTLPGRDSADAMVRGAAGMLLLGPGFFSDIVAPLPLLPPGPHPICACLRRRMQGVTVATAPGRWTEMRRLDDEGTIDLDSDDWRRH